MCKGWPAAVAARGQAEVCIGKAGRSGLDAAVTGCCHRGTVVWPVSGSGIWRLRIGWLRAVEKGRDVVQMRPFSAMGIGRLALPLLAVMAGTAMAAASMEGASAAAPGPAALVARSWSAGGGALFQLPNLSDVAASSAGDAWAVGGREIVHWNGRAWSRVPSPVRGLRSALSGVAVSSARNAWAVGATGAGKALIVRWNGVAWKRVPSPSPPGSSLLGVALTSARNAWAVGYAHAASNGDCGSCRTLILHWNGRAWREVPSPTPRKPGLLEAVAAASARSAWAVGTSGGRILIVHWNGRAWRQVASPALALSGDLTGVALTPAGRAWAVGGNGPTILIVHWNGTAWTHVPSPGGGDLFAVAAASASSAWAVGESGQGNAFILRWNGKAWRRARSPKNPFPGHAESLLGVTAKSARNAWAVGYAAGGGAGVILHWNGTAWKMAR